MAFMASYLQKEVEPQQFLPVARSAENVSQNGLSQVMSGVAN